MRRSSGKKSSTKRKAAQSKMPIKMPTNIIKKSTRTLKKTTIKAKPAQTTLTKKSPARLKQTTAVSKKSAPIKPMKKKRAITRAGTPPTNGQLKSYSIVETSPVAWSQQTNGPSFEQVQIAAYHRWLQSGGSDLDNWFSAEGDANGRKDS